MQTTLPSTSTEPAALAASVSQDSAEHLEPVAGFAESTQTSKSLTQQEQEGDLQSLVAAELDPAAAGYSSSPERALITNKSNKLEWQEGEDAKLKQMLWVVENLQEELFRSQEYRLKAEKRQQEDRGTIDQLQAELQEVMGQLAVLDDNLDMIQEQLDHQMGAQDENKDDARELDKELMSLQALIHVREKSIAEKDRRKADIEKQILNDIEDAKAAKRREQAENASPRSDASSPWGSPSEGSDDESKFRVSPARLPLSLYGREQLGSSQSIQTGASAASSGTASPAAAGWFRPFSMLGSTRKVATEDLKTAASTPQSEIPPAPQARTASFSKTYNSNSLSRASSGL